MSPTYTQEEQHATLTQRLLIEAVRNSLRPHERQQSALQGTYSEEKAALKSIRHRMEARVTEPPVRPDSSSTKQQQSVLRESSGTGQVQRKASEDWIFFMGQVDLYVNGRGLRAAEAPLLQLLPSALGERFLGDFKRSHLAAPWNPLDYGIVAASILVATLMDYFLVATPRGSFRGEPQPNTRITNWLKVQSNPLAIFNSKNPAPPNAFQEWVAKMFVVARKWEQAPFDVLSPTERLTANLQRLASGRSDPVLSLAVGIMDIVSGRCVFTNRKGRWNEINQLPGQLPTANIPVAILTLIVHGFSDVDMPSGHSAPYMGLSQLFEHDPSIVVEDENLPLLYEELTWYMSSNGYHMGQFLTQAISLATVELMQAAYHAVRAHNDPECSGEASMPERLKREQMLLITTAMLSSANVLKTGLFGWNPTAPGLEKYANVVARMLTVMHSVLERDQAAQAIMINRWQSLATDLFF